ncbi:MAG: pentapeptide repeat-containing protein [Deltaproteobacteria bacterium]|nr:pentapeptide repeat-containing protein [Deltaproteobacteria bacterium]
MQLNKEIFNKLKEGVVFFKNFNDGELLALLKSTQREVLKDNDFIFKEGTRGDKMYIVIGGKVKISRNIGQKQEEVLATLESGALFGEMGPIDQSPRSASAIAVGDTVCLSLREALLRQNNLALAYKLYKNFAVMLAERLRNTNQRLTEMSVSDRTSSEKIKDLVKKRMEEGVGIKGTDLRNANLSEVFLHNADLSESMMIHANLTSAKFGKANLQGCKMVGASFSGAQFEGTDMSRCDLTGATFEKAQFNNCNFSGANFTGADLQTSMATPPVDPKAAQKKTG